MVPIASGIIREQFGGDAQEAAGASLRAGPGRHDWGRTRLEELADFVLHGLDGAACRVRELMGRETGRAFLSSSSRRPRAV